MSIPIEQPFHFRQGQSPLLVSMPHCGTALLPGMANQLTHEAQALPDTDWYLPELYDFLAAMDVSVIQAHYSRYVVDLNRPIDDQPLYTSKTTGLFPEILFSGEPVFVDGGGFDDVTQARIKAEVWQPYHQKIAATLAQIREQHGYAILFDAHSIAARVPMLFDGTLPDFNLGNNAGLACSPALLHQMAQRVEQSPYSHVCNGRFKGGYITRHYGQPSAQIHALQLELSQATYLADETQTTASDYQLDPAKLQRVRPVLQQLIQSLLAHGHPSDEAQ
ncbi:N-formylglutamate deformylase [Vibrio rhizosphaerae]|uniref:N-formylglutamate deformylase n=1 Tax=Vibrio rhizosphaerae TaxID=398736 RepID=A0ABU4IT06_9VIBR|nr:N-formylglutamate deformylase [Vibrio rhizosphaerae]MDW6092414.1 N-formylglutamate deformylase [Vibrio rhizosphaerae]